MISGVCAAMIGNTGSGVATVTSPAPARSAAHEASTAAPLLPDRSRNDQRVAVVALVARGLAGNRECA